MATLLFLIPGFPYTFPITFESSDGIVQVEDYDPVYFLQPALLRHTSIVNMPYLSLQLFDNVHFSPDAFGTFQGPATLDILEGAADFDLRPPEGQATFDILEGPASFEIRTPE